ncbi:hypothetical protein J6590_032010 [Homalodisca vitripennis]|nr:hypothetical protein J6590_032010 [Homalodisca vitripennis]
MANAFQNMEIDLRCLVSYPPKIKGGAKSAHEHGQGAELGPPLFEGGSKSAHEHGQGAELGPPYSKGVLIQGMDTATVLI